MKVRAVITGLVSALLFSAGGSASLCAQTIDDGIMLGKGELFTGYVYTHDSWDEYWEGELKRDNGNIGTLITRTSAIFANYGLTDRVNVIATVPHVRTKATQGVLRGMSGFQDLTLAAKLRVLQRPTKLGSLRAMAVVAGGGPMTDYTPDFQPLSIGMGAKRFGGRLTGMLHGSRGLFVHGSAAYAWRSNVTLDRPYYFTENRLFFTDKVDMPGVFDYMVGVGYMNHGVMAALNFVQQRTQGGGDIRRQDMPFVSNRMNFSRVGGMVMTPLPKLRDLYVNVGYAYTIDGRNVGQSSTYSAGVFYKFHFLGRQGR